MAFKVGQKVVALSNPKNSNSQPRVKGKIYTVQDVMYCDKTGKQNINIGFYTKIKLLNCSFCGGTHKTNGKCWTNIRHFKPLHDDFVEQVIKQVTPKEVES